MWRVIKPVLQQIRLFTGLKTGGKTRKIAIQLVLQQCCKTSCTFLLPVFRYLPESGKFFLVESGILGFAILNLSKKVRNPTNETRTNPESTAWKAESKTVLDSLTRGETSRKGFI